jgi:hypothetical protein
MPEGGEGTAGKLLPDDVVLLVLLMEAGGLCSAVSTMRPSGGGTQASRRCGRRSLNAGW